MKRLLSAFKHWRLANIGATAHELRVLDKAWCNVCDTIRKDYETRLEQQRTGFDRLRAACAAKQEEYRKSLAEREQLLMQAESVCSICPSQITVQVSVSRVLWNHKTRNGKPDQQIRKSVLQKTLDALDRAAKKEAA